MCYTDFKCVKRIISSMYYVILRTNVLSYATVVSNTIEVC